MLGRSRKIVILLGAAAAAAAAAVPVVRHGRGAATGRRVPGGILVGDAVAYDNALSRLVLGSLFRSIAADVAAVAPDGARVLEVGCGPGRLSIRLARQHGLEVTGLDLDPAMIERARANAERAGDGDERRPSFLVGDVASLPFPDRSFDLVVTTLSMHHWADPTAGLVEIGRVLRPGARALVWDFRPSRPGVWSSLAHLPGPVGKHARLPDPVEHTQGSPLRVVSATPWRWPWRFNLTQRTELVRADGSPGHSSRSSTTPSPTSRRRTW
jgi:SAM-dependent methyltransferase